MIDRLIYFSIHNKLIISFLALSLIAWGIYSAQKLPLDAVPDITNNQVQIVTFSPTLAPLEVEKFITFPVEMALANIQNRVEIRSISRFGLSIVTVVFEEDMDLLKARQLVAEQLKAAENDIPPQFGSPEMMPITTGLGEIYQYTLVAQKGFENRYSPKDLRTVQDWIVKRHLAGIGGVADISSFGGFIKEYEVAILPEKLRSFDITMSEVFEALQKNNENSGGSYIEKNQQAYYIRAEGLVTELADIEQIVVRTQNDLPILIRDLAEVKINHPPRMGAMTKDGIGEAVGGIILMLKGANSSEVIDNVHLRVAEVQKILPEGLRIEPYLDRSVLVEKAIHTVGKNLLEGGLIVIFVLVLLLGNFRAGLVVASVIPLALLFAFGMMNLFGVSANLMSLGAIDFGLVVDGAVIIVEAVIHRLHHHFSNKRLTAKELNESVYASAVQIRQSAAFGELIILMVYLPIFSLTGIEGKMFKPMAQTVGFAILGALILSLTYVPMMASLFLSKNISSKLTFADRLMAFFLTLYEPFLRKAIRFKNIVLAIILVAFLGTMVLFLKMGGEFIPTLDEGDMACQVVMPPDVSLSEMVKTTVKVEKVLMQKFPEIRSVVAKIGSSEIPTDPMGVGDADVMILLKPKSEWTSAASREELADKMKAELENIAGIETEFTQPIQLRFNELMTGVKSDIAIKIFGEDLEILARKAQEIGKLIEKTEGVGDLRIEQTEGLPQLVVRYKREKMAQYGLTINELNTLIRMAYAGETAGKVYEGEKRFDLVVRLAENYRNDLENIENLYVHLPNGSQVYIKELAEISLEEAPLMISREDTKRRIVIGINVRNRDVESLVKEMQANLEKNLTLPAGYSLSYGGQFENLQAAKNRLLVAVPAALLLIFVMLFMTFDSFKQALMIFTAIPLSAIGGILALWVRGMPFSISAGVGFIALFGVAVLNGIVLIGQFNELEKKGVRNALRRVWEGTQIRFRPVLMTATVAALGFFPMALSGDAGAEVQKPLATVVIGGIFSSTLLTLLILPILYLVFGRRKK